MPPHSADERWMRLALGLARRGLGRVWPNPAVGCVLVKNGRVVGRGWTQPGGRPHAEVGALAQAGKDAQGATAYVTLEPCAHHGQTPPCAVALIDAHVARVVSALPDPDPRVSGRGHAMLADAGVDVVTGVMSALAAETNLGFLTRITKSCPMITLKLAASLDGRIATPSGDSRWITGTQARRIVHMMRATHDAVMIGSGTAIADDPDLRVRDLGLAERSPVRVIIDSTLKTPTSGRLGQTARDTPVWLCHRSDADATSWQQTGARLISCRTNETGGVDLKDALEQLALEGITRVFCEGGGRLAAALVRENLVDRLITFSAGLAIGGDGRPSLGLLGIDQLSDAPRYKLRTHQSIGEDIMSVWQPA